MTTATRRTWSPVTTTTLQHDFEDAHDSAMTGRRKHWPRGWFAWQTARIVRDARVIRKTREATR